MKLYVQKPGGWTALNPQGVFEEVVAKVTATGLRREYRVYYRVVDTPQINVDTKHRQPADPATVRTGLRIRQENWEAPGPHVMGHGSVLTLKENHFYCLDCKRMMPMHLESQTQAAVDFQYRSRNRGRVRRDAVLFSETKIKGMVPYRNKFSYSNVCTKCANKRVSGAVAVVPVAPAKPQAQPFVATVYAPRPKKVIEQYGMIVNGRHGGSKLKIGGHNVIRREDIELYNLAILSKRKSTASLKPRIHKAA